MTELIISVLGKLSLCVIIKRKRISSEKIYRWKKQEIVDDIYNLMITHKDSLPNTDIINSVIFYINYWEKELDRGPPDEINHVDSAIESAINRFFELIPPFFCA
jgi:hypothetical protein